jgi:PAS domain S-box-containing protein
VAGLAVALDLLLFLSLRSNLTAGVNAALDAVASTTKDQARIVGNEVLSERLAQLGIRATVRRANGSVVANPGPTVAGSSGTLAHRSIDLPGGATVDVAVSRAAADRSLGRLVHRELVITPLVVALALMLLRLIAEIAVRPLDAIADAARRTADGQRGERLHPHPVDTRLGRMATAYDEMLDALEAAVVDSERAQHQSDRLQEHYHRVLETAHDAFVSMDATGRVVEWNRQAEGAFGWTRDEALGRCVADTIIPPEYRSAHRAELTRFLSSGTSGLLGRRIEHIGQRRDGGRFPMEIKAWATRDGDEVIFNAFIRDITEEQRLADQLDATLGALETALYEAQASEGASRRFFDDAAHQLRAPITGIRACAETLMRGVVDPEEQTRLLAAVVREASRAGRLMSGLLQMARLNQRSDLVLEPCSIVDLCRDEADRMFYVAPHLDVAITETGPQPPLPLYVDRHAVGEIVANLLDNAARHAHARIELVIGWESGRVSLRVVDDGPGLAPGTADSAFERFVSLDGKGGCGLGLPIARALARAHDGDLTYEDKAFVLRLPVSQSTSEAKPVLPVVTPGPVPVIG